MFSMFIQVSYSIQLDTIGTELTYVQTLGLIDVFNSLFRITKTNIITNIIQQSGRLFLLYFIILPYHEINRCVMIIPLYMAWSIIEFIRYPFYALSVLNICPNWIRKLRYTAFIPLYPIGLCSEWFIIYKFKSMAPYTMYIITHLGKYIRLLCTNTNTWRV